MNAQEARKLSESHISEEHKHQMSDVKSIIRSAATEGKTSVYYYQTVRNDVKAVLIQEGFEIKESNDRDGYMCIIKW